jgi:hypothetical protein
VSLKRFDSTKEFAAWLAEATLGEIIEWKIDAVTDITTAKNKIAHLKLTNNAHKAAGTQGFLLVRRKQMAMLEKEILRRKQRNETKPGQPGCFVVSYFDWDGKPNMEIAYGDKADAIIAVADLASAVISLTPIDADKADIVKACLFDNTAD